MALDHASRDRVDALTVRPHPDAPSPAVEDPPSRPDPDFWGVEPRRVRRRRSADHARGPRPERGAALVERVRSTRIEVGAGVVALVILALVAGVIWYRANLGGDPPPAPRRAPAERAHPSDPSGRPAPVPAGATVVTVASPSTTPHRGETVVVHVAGAVVRPGVLLMPAGARVIDAVEGAGGATPEADLDRLNLAARLADGQRILVVQVGGPVGVDPSGAGDASVDPAARIDLNSATVAQLDTLPGIGPTLAGAILAERDRRGGFRSINELREVRGIGEARFADLRERVTV